MKVVVLMLPWLLLMMSFPTAIAQGPVAAAEDRYPRASTFTRLVDPIAGKTGVHYPEGVMLPGNETLQPRTVIGAYVRITAAPTIEMSGLVRIQGQTITGCVLSRDDDTVTLVSGTDSVTVPRAGRRVIGVITQLEQLTLTITRADGSAVMVPRTAIARLEQQVGLRSRKGGAALAFLIGGGAGAGVGFLIGSSCHSSAFLGCFMEPAVSTAGGLILGGVAGTVLGALSGSREKWETVPVAWLDGQAVTP